MTDKNATSKFQIHEAARDGKRNDYLKYTNETANPKLADQKDDDERLPIHWAVSYGHLDIAILLASQKNFDPDVQDGSGWTPLMIAVSLKEGEELVDLLLRKEADVNSKNFNGQVHFLRHNLYALPLVSTNTIPAKTALHFTASKNNLDVARKLLDNKPPASTRVKDKRGQYAIHRAAAVGSVPMVELLLKNRSPLNPSDIAGQTPLHHAIAEGHGDTAVALLKAGAETDKKDVDGCLAMELAPDAQVRKFILQTAEREGIDL
ncbi:putative proteasome regulatory particle subunit 2 [Coleophoma crateriformis]|uniref:Putative proteasome regulatory particle subunit 2 n=1 Tax=Coleophoma crateriformis TaxID=565419 RepID=A0A3D8RD89_9HELO|nr:putative proteasome regulatory particle subunit 2 [Coleophoma crateriformis]